MLKKICGNSQTIGFISFIVAVAVAVMSGCAPSGTVKPSPPSTPVVTESDFAAEQARTGTVEDAAIDKKITGIRVEETPNAWIVEVSANHVADYTLAESPLEEEVVIYFAESLLGVSQTEYPSESDLIGTVSAIDLIKNGPCKIVIPVLQSGIAYDARRGSDPDVLEVVFNKPAMAKQFAEDMVVGGDIADDDDLMADAASLDETAMTADSPLPPARPATMLEGIKAVAGEAGVEIKVSADGMIEDYKKFILTTPPRIVFDLPGIKSSYSKEQRFPVGSDMVKQVRHFSHPDYLRVVLDVDEAGLSQYTGISQRDGMTIYVGDVDQMVDAAEPIIMGDTETAEAEMAAGLQTQEAPEVAAVDAAAEETMTAAVTDEPPVDAVVADRGGPADGTVDSSRYDRPALVNKIDFITEAAGKTSLEIGTTHPVNYDLAQSGEKKIQLRLKEADILSFRQRPLITTRFDSAVDLIMPFQTEKMKNRHISAIDITLRDAVGYSATRDGNLITVTFDASSVPPDPAKEIVIPTDYKLIEEDDVLVTEETLGREAKADVAEEETTEETMAAVPETSPEAAGSEAAPAPEENLAVVDDAMPDTAVAEDPSDITVEDANEVPPVLVSRKKTTYTGEPIALDFYKTDIRNVIRILKDVSGKNFAIDKGVEGSVTLSFINPVPWDQVLDLILEMNDLGQVERDGIIRIATQETLRKQKESAQAALAAEQDLKKTEETLAPLETEYFAISYADAGAEVLPHISSFLSDRGHAKVDARTNQVIMTDVPDRIKKAREVIEKIDQVTPQVMIQARIVETSTDFSREIGTRWGTRNYFLETEKFGANNDDWDTAGATQSSWPGTYVDDVSGAEGTYTYGVALNNLAAPVSNAIGLDFAKILGTPFSLDARLSLMEAEGEGKVISTPKIVTMDNKEAIISQGEEIPYTTVSADGTDTQFKDAELELRVTPHVTPDNRIALKINLQQKEPIAGISEEPPLNTKEASTELLVNDGDTVVIGGIMQQSTRNSEAGIPWISKIPVLGNLFKYKTASEDKDELLIFITPSIVRLE